MKFSPEVLERILEDAEKLCAAKEHVLSRAGLALQYEPMVFELALQMTGEPAVAFEIVDQVFALATDKRLAFHAEPARTLLERLTIQAALLTQMEGAPESIQ